MKPLKKVLALVLTLAMVFSLATAAFAYDITINGANQGHTFKAYQILKGTKADGDTSDSLGNPEWGEGVDAAGLMAAVNAKFDLKDDNAITDAASLVKYLSEHKDAATVDAFAEVAAQYVKGDGIEVPYESGKTYKTTGLDAGYYLIKDETARINGQDDNSRYMLQFVNYVEVNAKLDYPDVEKFVRDYNDSTGASSEWIKSADYDIGDDVEFKLKGTIPDLTGYKTYYYAFHDQMADTLKLNPDSFEVTVGGVKVTTGYTIKTNPKDGCTFEVIFTDLISVIEQIKDQGYDPAKGVEVTYTAELTKDAVIGNPGQQNKVRLEFSNNPNPSETPKPSETPAPGESETPAPGESETPEPGESETPAPGESETPEPSETPGPDTGFTPWDEVVVFTYDVVVNKKDEKNEALKGAEFTLEKFVYDENGELDENIGKKGRWVAVDGTTAEAGTQFEFKGLDDGNYRLTETKAPAGYNKADPIYFEVKATHNEEDGSTTTSVVAPDGFSVVNDEKNSNGTIETDVVNQKGAELPETGGIGTTIFYVIGSLLVLFAGVLLIVKRRMKSVD